MSSLLKALKQEQSPLASQSSQIDPRLLDPGRVSTRHSRPLFGPILVGTVVLLSVVVSAGLIWNPLSTDADIDVQPTPTPRYQLGSSSSLPNLSWEAQPSPKETIVESSPEATTATPTEPSATNATTNGREPLDMEQVSSSLLAKFEQAVAQTQASDPNNQTMSVVPALTELNAGFQRQVQPFSYDGHMYVSAESRRWVELNNQRLYLGDNYQNMTVTRIEPQQVILSMQGKAFSVEALSDWQPSSR